MVLLPLRVALVLLPLRWCCMSFDLRMVGIHRLLMPSCLVVLQLVILPAAGI